MTEFTYELAGETRYAHVVDHINLRQFTNWLIRNRREVLGLDTEATGLNTYGRDFRVRLVQVSDDFEAWIIDPSNRIQLIQQMIFYHEGLFTLHNAPFDAAALSRLTGLGLREILDKCRDTRTMAHLLDTRTKAEGGTGHRLKEVASVYVDPDATDGHTELVKEFRKLGFTKETGWANIPIDNEVYLRYAGQDPLLARLLHDELLPLVEGTNQLGLFDFETEFSKITAEIVQRGMRVDVSYTQVLSQRLAHEEQAFTKRAATFGLLNVNSPQQVTSAILATGETLTERTPSGGFKTDAAILLPLADLDRDWQRIGARDPNPLVDSVIRAKRARKWNTTYAQAFLDGLDEKDRLHPRLNPLAARTARMSISDPPLQQLPAKDHTIRAAIVADPGELIVSCDFSQVEMRVLAALCQDPNLLGAIMSGEDLHDATARLVFGVDFTSQQRKLAKNINFGKVYGGGPTTIQRQTGAPMALVKESLAKYDAVFPRIKAYGYELQRKARHGRHEVVTPSGRHLILDRDRAYAATNYMCQSTARDLMAQALVEIWDRGMGKYVINVIHDEVLATVPPEDAENIRQQLEDAMTMDFLGVPITAEAEIFGASWGDGYRK